MADLESLILNALINLLLRGTIKLAERTGAVVIKKLKSLFKRDKVTAESLQNRER